MAAQSKLLWNPLCYSEPNLGSQCQRSAIKTAPHAVKCNRVKRTILISFQPFSQSCSPVMGFALSLRAQTAFNCSALSAVPCFLITRDILRGQFTNLSSPPRQTLTAKPDAANKYFLLNQGQKISTTGGEYPGYPVIVTRQS